ncbi:unnamed protein product [Rhizophagus irregularis]|nr:unnamed protein product [Rhizophagus irregularis]CAB5365080.1 unnamed protein product [Rhizophagus irregularis]
MGNTFSGRKPFKIKRKKSVDECSECPNSIRFIYVDTIKDANFSWLEGRRVSADDFFPIARQVEGTDRIGILMHDIYKYMLKGNTKTPLTSIKRCLHIGSGHNIWLIEMANDNREIQFEGFDIKTGNIDMNSLPENLTFTHGNIFENGLPYPDNYFDYVNVRSLLGWLPRDKISFVIEEIRRVTIPGGKLEMLETDVIIKNATEHYEEKLGKIWRDLCACKGYDPNNVIELDKFLERDFFGITNSKLSIPIGGFGGKVGELYAEAFICAVTTIASVMEEKLNMTDKAIKEYLSECIEKLNIAQAYTNIYLVSATKSFR